MKEQIMAWLQGPRNYAEGVELYKMYGYNKALKKTYERGETVSNMESLTYELAKMLGVEDKINSMKRFAAKPKEVKAEEPKQVQKLYVDDLLLELADRFKVNVDDLFTGSTAGAPMTDTEQSTFDLLAPKYAEIPETMKKTIRFRETYPFLKDPECPNELKVLVADMFSAYDRYREAYAKLSPEKIDSENFENAASVVENYLENRSMWEELDYYKENGKVLGKHPVFAEMSLKAEIAATPDIELSKKLNNASSNITKNKNKVETATDPAKKAEYQDKLNHWTKVQALIQSEIDTRKKK
ncbi:MAG TPA: hypothetical protein VK152_00320 [Paludibacter sp.]|nr:hypothetical protein [Paludibacter sp.]